MGGTSSSVRYAEPRDLTQIVSLEYEAFRSMDPSTSEQELAALLESETENGTRIAVTSNVDACAICFLGPTELYIKSLAGSRDGKVQIVRWLQDAWGSLRIHVPPEVDARTLFQLKFRVGHNFEPPKEANLDAKYWTRCESFTWG